ncbi:MAG: hypothetical protein QX203_14475 [Methylococcaceae bacterium]
MNVPNNVFQAVIAMWASLIIAAIMTLFEQKLGNIPNDFFAIALITIGLLSIFPYKIFNRSNVSRYIYTVWTVLSVFHGLGSEEDPTIKLESIPTLILSIIELPLEIFIIYKLFTRESNLWFSTRT